MNSQTNHESGATGRFRKSNRSEPAASLGDVLKDIMAGRISKIQGKINVIEQSWNDLLPAELLEHCRIDSFEGGVLKVVVDSPGYMHEMRLCQEQLLEQMKELTTGVGLRDIRFVIG